MNVVDVAESERSLRNLVQRNLEQQRDIRSGVLVSVDVVGSPKVLGMSGYVWVREDTQAAGETGGVIPVLNPGAVPETLNRPVLVGPSPRNPYRRVILGQNLDLASPAATPGGTNDYTFASKHAQSHVFVRGQLDPTKGTDITYMTEANFAPCVCLPTSPPTMFVRVWKGAYIHNGVPQNWLGGLTPDLSASVPGAGLARFTNILIDGATNTTELLDGPTFTCHQPYIDPIPYGVAAITIPIGHLLCGRVFLYPGITAISELNFMYDTKPLLHTLASAGGGVTLDADADVLLSLTGSQLGLDPQAANAVLAGPVSGSASAPTFRQLAVTQIAGYYEPLTNADPPDPELVFEADGDVIMCEE